MHRFLRDPLRRPRHGLTVGGQNECVMTRGPGGQSARRVRKPGSRDLQGRMDITVLWSLEIEFRDCVH